jgi:hypothetical protein
MIKNERQYRITKAQAEKFRQAIQKCKTSQPPDVHPVLRKAQVDALKSQFADLQRELTAYERLKLPEAIKGFVLLPRRWVGERSVAWTTRFRRLVRDCERWPETLAGLHFLAFAILMLKRVVMLMVQSA